MTNKWIQHVKEFAKNNNISYGCALTHPDIKKGYEKAKTKKEQNEEREKIIIEQIVNGFLKKVKSIENDDQKNIYQNTFLKMPKITKERFKEKYPKYYNSLFD